MTRRQKTVTALFALAICSPPLMGAEYFSGEKFRDPLGPDIKGPEMVVLPQGNVVLGGGQPGPDGAGLVSIDYPIAVSATEITLGQYRQFLESSHSGNVARFAEGDPQLPVTRVSWDDAEAYTTWLSRTSGHHYRLPSASEWEYAARAGSSLAYSWGNEVGSNNANCMTCDADYEGQPAPVASFKPNQWGLYDMHGNVWEWTWDCIDANSAPPNNGMPQLFGDCELRELRGGSAQSDGWSIRASARASAPRKTRLADVGFRVVREIRD